MSTTAGHVDETTVVGQPRHVGTVAVDDRAVLVDEEAGRGFALNATAALVWRLFDGESPLGAIIDDLSETFGVARDEMAGSVMGLASTLGQLGLLDGVLRSWGSLPIDIEYVDVDQCGEPIPAQEAPTFDSRYLAAPPNA